MELKVWCDGIQRIVCGATASTTCQDVVFALAHATGQTGRFILIEKWKNNERVLAPNDKPVISLAKWGEFANDVTFVMKKSGDVIQKPLTPKLSKKSETDLTTLQKRKKMNWENNISKSLPRTIQSSPQLSSITSQKESNYNLNSTLPSRVSMNSSSHQIENRNFLSIKNDHNKFSNSIINEPLYGSLNKNRPKQPPPYKEAIAKSSLANIMNNSANTLNDNYHHNYTTMVNLGSSQSSYCKNIENRPQVTTIFQNEKANNKSQMIASNLSDAESLAIQQKTISLISIQQKTLKKQGQDIADLENEIDIVQRKLSENEFIVHRYKDEMEFLKQKCMEQETLIEQLESENMEHELEKLAKEGKRFEDEIKEVKINLSNCEKEILRRRDEIGRLMDKIKNFQQSNGEEMNDPELIDQLKMSIQEKNNKIQSQKMELNTLNDSLEDFDQSLQTKNSIVDNLTYQIKEANVEGLTLQASTIPVEEKNCPNFDQSPHLKSGGVTRKIPVSLHELGNTVPTKKNPDGIWV